MIYFSQLLVFGRWNNLTTGLWGTSFFLFREAGFPNAQHTGKTVLINSDAGAKGGRKGIGFRYEWKRLIAGGTGGRGGYSRGV